MPIYGLWTRACVAVQVMRTKSHYLSTDDTVVCVKSVIYFFMFSGCLNLPHEFHVGQFTVSSKVYTVCAHHTLLHAISVRQYNCKCQDDNQYVF